MAASPPASTSIRRTRPPLAELLKNGGKYPAEYLVQPQNHNSTILYQAGTRIVELCGDNTIVKSGQGVEIDEVNAFSLARELHLPVPEVYEAHSLPNNGASIRMSYIHGENLQTVWPTIICDQKQHVAVQLRHIVDKMRSIPSNENTFRSCSGGMVRDLRAYNSFTGGPFEDEKSFNAFVLDVPKSTPEENIIVQGSKITGLLDWEFAGWFPEYWEYIKFFQRPSAHDD